MKFRDKKNSARSYDTLALLKIEEFLTLIILKPKKFFTLITMMLRSV
jgi:hypothetical protein